MSTASAAHNCPDPLASCSCIVDTKKQMVNVLMEDCEGGDLADVIKSWQVLLLSGLLPLIREIFSGDREIAEGRPGLEDPRRAVPGPSSVSLCNSRAAGRPVPLLLLPPPPLLLPLPLLRMLPLYLLPLSLHLLPHCHCHCGHHYHCCLSMEQTQSFIWQVIHRDIKPSNILFSKDRTAKLGLHSTARSCLSFAASFASASLAASFAADLFSLPFSFLIFSYLAPFTRAPSAATTASPAALAIAQLEMPI